MITAAVWLGWFAALGIFKLDDRWDQTQRRFLLVLWTVAPVLASISINA
jgi:hypothetical protein